MRILHVITNLHVGGAEVMLQRLLQASSRGEELSHEVVSLRGLGDAAGQIRQLGVRTHALGMGRFPSAANMLRLAKLIRDSRAEVVQTWMYHADLIGGVTAKLAGNAKIFWGIHNSTLDSTRRSTRWTVALCARLSHWIPDGIVSVSRASRELHVAAGYDPLKFTFIPNGFDLTHFRPDPASRREVRETLGLPAAAVVIALVARVEKQKDHPNFIRAAALLAKWQPDARFLLCGEGTAAENRELVHAIAQERLLDRFLLLGRRNDVERIMSSVDICTLSSSFGEACPLVIGEAMACGTPCVVTDLGDCAYLVGDTGRVVPPRDPAALARGWEAFVRLGPDGRRRLGLAARDRIASRFSLPSIAEQYVALYRRVLEAPGRLPPAPSHAVR